MWVVPGPCLVCAVATPDSGPGGWRCWRLFASPVGVRGDADGEGTHIDRDIRFTSNTGWYTGVIKNMGVEVDCGTLNYKKRNAQCERQIKAFKTITRILIAEESRRNWIKLVPVAVYMKNNQISSWTGYSPTEMFLGRPGFFYEFPKADDCNAKVKDRLEDQRPMAEKAQGLPTKVWNLAHRRQNRGKSNAEYREGDLVLVQNTRFSRWPGNELDLPYFRPHLVTEAGPSTQKVEVSPSPVRFVDVGYNQLKGTLQREVMTWKLWKNWRPKWRSQRWRLTRTSTKEACKKETEYTNLLKWTMK